MAVMVWASFAAAFVDIILVLMLTGMYVQTYRNIKSGFTAGLVVFGAFLVILNLSIVLFWMYLFLNIQIQAGFVETAATYLFLMSTVQLVALATLVRITWNQ